MHTADTSLSTRFKVGLFVVTGLVLVGLVTVYVNDKPYWWRRCQLVNISVEDATGLKMKSPIKSLGIEIGYLHSVDLSETHVKLGICITAPVEVLSDTRAYIRPDGLLGDKFVELRPVKYLGSDPLPEGSPLPTSSGFKFSLISDAMAADAEAASPPAEVPLPGAAQRKAGAKGSREIPVGAESQDVQHIVGRVDELVNQVTGLANNLKDAINPEDMKRTLKELNTTLQNASKTLSPESGLNQTAQRTLAKLEDSIEQLRDLMTRVNKGEGSVGMLLNDPAYAEDIRTAIKNMNRLLSTVGDVRFNVDVGGVLLQGADAGGRGWFLLGIWPKPERYYLVGVAVDPRGKTTTTTTDTSVAGVAQPRVTTSQTETTGILFTAMLGRVWWRRVDTSIGVLYNDGAASLMLNLWKNSYEDSIQARLDVYSRGGTGIDGRVSLTVRPWMGTYLRVGGEGFLTRSPMNLFAGAGVAFDDQDIRLLFAFK